MALGTCHARIQFGALIWQGNRELLSYEQEVVLQVQVYDRSRDIWPVISDDVPSPIPEHGIKFIDYVPGGDIGSFKDRWKWIEESMLPAWTELEMNKPARVASLLQALRCVFENLFSVWL